MYSESMKLKNEKNVFLNVKLQSFQTVKQDQSMNPCVFKMPSTEKSHNGHR